MPAAPLQHLLDVRSVQRQLQAVFPEVGNPDGQIGPLTLAAARKAVNGSLGGVVPSAWSDQRLWTATEQWAMLRAGIDVGTTDGIAGVRTQIGVEKWQDWLAFTRLPLADAEIAHLGTRWPRQSAVRQFYGEPGENLVRITSPYPLYLDWDLSQRIDSFLIHSKCAASAKAVLQKTLDHYGAAAIHNLGIDQFGGCFNKRVMRNGTALSLHSWAIAIDWNADKNPLRATSKTALFATPPYAPFLDFWEQEGWVSLGRARNYDWMHVQAARL